MKTSVSKLTLLISVLAVSSWFTAPVVRAAGDATDAKAQKAADAKAKHDAEVLRKYDKNGNGILDPEEQAARQANVDKMKALRDARKHKAEERKANAEKTNAASAGNSASAADQK